MHTITNDPLIIAGRKFKSRLFIGTGKYPSVAHLSDAITHCDTELVTVSLRRMDLDSPQDEFLESIDQSKVLLVPNTSGARTAAEALKLAQLAKEAAGYDWVKLELTPEPRYLLPDPIETLKASELLVKNGFKVLPYINADPVLSKKLEDAGCAAVMPLGSLIGSNKGLQTIEMIKIIIQGSRIPVIVDAGLGKPSHAAAALEIGADAVLVNTAIATAKNPSKIAYAFKLAVEAGRLAYLNSGVTLSDSANPSSPSKNFINNL